MFDGNDSVFNNSLKHVLQILQNVEFTHSKFLLWSQKLWRCEPALIQLKISLGNRMGPSKIKV